MKLGKDHMKRLLIAIIGNLVFLSYAISSDVTPEQKTKVPLLQNQELCESVGVNLIQDATPQDIAHIIQKLTQKDKPNTGFSVRQSNTLASQEIQTLTKRLPKIRQYMQKKLKTTLPYRHLPNIALIGSGGGYRSMIASLGFLHGIQKIGVLDSTWYMSTLSGSAWMHAAWLRNQRSLKDFKSFLQKKVATDLFATPVSFMGITEILARKIYNGQKVSLVDLWGALIGNMLFSEISPTGKDIFLSDLAAITYNGKYPLPIFSSISPRGNGYKWFEHTPWEIGSFDDHVFIPTKAFGSPFNAGKSTMYYSEQTLGYHLGIGGSAFAMNAQELFRIYQTQIQDNILLRGLEDIITDLKLGSIRLTRAQINNFMQHMVPLDTFPQNDTLTLIDAGIDINLAIPPMLRRYVDVFIICDAVSDVPLLQAYKQAIVYAAQHGFKLPPVTTETIDATSIAVFIDQDNPKTPIVIYIPNKEDYSLFKFKYSDEEFINLYGSMKLKVQNNEKTIWQAIKTKIEQLKTLYPHKDFVIPLGDQESA